jgi:predicted ATPase
MHHHSETPEATMVDQAALAELDKRIQIVEDNLRELVEQAAAYSGAADEARNADRIANQQAKLDALLKEREALLAKG